MVPRVGQKIGPYEILGRLGSGGMGLVFSAWDARLHRDVAIKLLKDEYLNPTMRSRFLGEARAASRLNHPNICTIFDIGEEQDCPYMVMELLKGETLRGRMQKGVVPVEDILQVATEIADALSVAHARGIVHRDIKPANVVLVDKHDGSFQTKVLDFGLAKVDMEGLDSRSGLTTTGMTVGTVSYMSPEQARGELLDGRSDLFSLGVLMYEMSSGRLPFDGATSALIFVQLLNHPPESLRGLNATVPKPLEQVINTCLQKKRDDRYQTAQELVSSLQRAAQTISSGSEKSASWFGKFAGGLKREVTAAAPTQVDSDAQGEELGEATTPLRISSEEAFLKPFRPARRQSSDSRHYQPVNKPYSSPEEVVGAAEDQQMPVVTQDYAAQKDEDPLTAQAAEFERGSSRRSSYGMSKQIPALDWLEEPVEAPSLDQQPAAEKDSPSLVGWRILLGILLALAIIVVSIAVLLSKRRWLSSAPLPKSVAILQVANHTGDSTLSGIMISGLRLALEQSRTIDLRASKGGKDVNVGELAVKGTASFAALQRFAQASGATVFVLGEVRMEGATYSMSLHAYDSQKGKALGDCTSTALSRERVIGAIDGLATSLRSVLGESSASLEQASMPLSKQATNNMEALQAYSQAENLQADKHYVDAMRAYQHASSVDAQFTQAYLRLAEMYDRQHAELSAAEAANHAASATGGDQHTRILANGMQALLANGDPIAAADAFTKLTHDYPAKPDGYALLATSQRLRGDYAAALASAQKSTSLSPADENAVRELKLALLGSEHVESVAKVTSSNKDLQNGIDQLANLVLTTVPPAYQPSNDDPTEELMLQAALSDATGRFASGLSLWRAAAAQAASTPELTSAAAYALSQAALNRALIGDCATALSVEQEASPYPAGPQAIFAMGMASGLCGRSEEASNRQKQLANSNGQSFYEKAFYSSDLNAVAEWMSGASPDALVTLKSAADYDLISLTPYLRGRVYLTQKQPQPASVEFQTMLRHSGALAVQNPTLLPATYLALARAFAANGDAANATQTYRKLSKLFAQGDANNAVVFEARVGASQ